MEAKPARKVSKLNQGEAELPAESFQSPAMGDMIIPSADDIKHVLVQAMLAHGAIGGLDTEAECRRLIDEMFAALRDPGVDNKPAKPALVAAIDGHNRFLLESDEGVITVQKQAAAACLQDQAQGWVTVTTWSLAENVHAVSDPEEVQPVPEEERQVANYLKQDKSSGVVPVLTCTSTLAAHNMMQADQSAFTIVHLLDALTVCRTPTNEVHEVSGCYKTPPEAAPHTFEPSSCKEGACAIWLDLTLVAAAGGLWVVPAFHRHPPAQAHGHPWGLRAGCRKHQGTQESDRQHRQHGAVQVGPGVPRSFRPLCGSGLIHG
jgi:hypothetical protein